LQSIAKKYNLSEQFSGYILAVASGIPEFTTNLVAATSEKGNVNIGVGNVTGSGSFGNLQIIEFFF
jgi:Ca2+/Na+ antiporter